MLQLPCMYQNAFRHPTFGGRAFLVIGGPLLFLMPVVCAAGLREEAVSYRTQGYDAQQRGDPATALSFYQKAATLDPSYPTPQNDIGVVMEGQGRLEDAERAYQQALKLNPEYLEAHANLAMLYERTGRKDQAASHWQQRYQLGRPNDPWTVRAQERLIALGALSPTSPPAATPSMSAPSTMQPRPTRSQRRQLMERELDAHEQSLEEFHAVTEEQRQWSK